MAISSSSSSTEIWTSSESSSSSEVLNSIKGLTYYSDFKDVNSVNNPLVGSNAQMQFYGFWDKSWHPNELLFDNVGYGLRKTRNNQGMIYCNNASRLFSTDGGYVGIVLSLPQDIINGVYRPLINNTLDYNEHILWGINIGQYEYAQPALYAALTPRGIEFTIWNSDAKHIIRDTVSNVAANTDIFLEFSWGKGHNEITYDKINLMILRVNGEDIVVSDPPAEFNDLTDSKFNVLDTPFLISDLECTIKKLVIYNRIPENILPYISSSSSDSMI